MWADGVGHGGARALNECGHRRARSDRQAVGLTHFVDGQQNVVGQFAKPRPLDAGQPLPACNILGRRMEVATRAYRVLGLAGSLRKASYNRAALRQAVELAPSGLAIEIFDLKPIPLYDGDLEEDGFPGPVEELRRAIRDADALLVVTPEYNYSISAVLKNAIDWASRRPDPPLRDKPVAMMGASVVAEGSQRAQAALRQILEYPQARVMEGPELAIGRIAEKCNDAPDLVDPATLADMRAFLRAFHEWLARAVVQ